ncbi:hypothetical protein Dd1591_2532 [Dickeya chrysanthemi Ech1591]|uniref:Uncharacterized protein n=1 Tax=Dickeya chrysanthemi (strain Ech1591) TaxID=561229 RepID=C6CL75_DICC1|nr:hypothetical protein Dd1591_2532 [Dickeya chrysanthemi Ech1591]
MTYFIKKTYFQKLCFLLLIIRRRFLGYGKKRHLTSVFSTYRHGVSGIAGVHPATGLQQALKFSAGAYAAFIQHVIYIRYFLG